MTVIDKPAPGGNTDEVVELRIHGVGGATAEGLLAHKDSEHYKAPYKIAGDDITGFFRGTWNTEKRGRVLEGYVWGGLTSKKASRALWLLLLPFSLANVAGWMIEPRDEIPTHPTTAPPKPDTSEVNTSARIQMGAVRFFSAGLTVLVLSWFGAMLVDLIAYQCGGQIACTDGRVWMRPFTPGSIAAYPARRMMLGSVALLLGVAVLAILSFKSQDRYEVRTYPEGSPSMGRDGAGLTDPGFWASAEFVRRLTYLHIGLAIAAVGALYSLGLDSLNSENGFAIGRESTIAVAVVVGFLIAIALFPLLGGKVRPSVWLKLLWIVPLVGIAALFWRGWDIGPATPVSAPGLQQVFGRAPIYVALALAFVVLVVLAIRFARWWKRPAKPGWAALVATVFWLTLIILAVAWHQIPWIQDRDTRLAIAAAGLVTVAIAWITARGREWQAVIATILVLATAVVWIGGGDEHGAFWVLAAITGLAALAGVARSRGAARTALIIAIIGAVAAGVLVDIERNLAVQWVGLGILGAGFLPTLGADLGRKDSWRWGGPVTAVGLSLLITLAIAAGSMVALADFLDRDIAQDSEVALSIDEATAETGPLEIELIQLYRVLALLLVGAAALTFIAAALHALRIRVDIWGRHRDAIGESYRSGRDDKRPSDDYVDCADDNQSAVVSAAITGRTIGSAARDIDVLLTTLVTVPLAGITLAVARMIVNTSSVGDFADLLENPVVTEHWSPLVQVAVLALAALPVAGVEWIRRARADEDSRKSVGTLWDVLTFWPRRFHPLAPPSYAERAVPEFAARVRQLSREGSKVMIVAHSQGTVIAAAAVALLRAQGKLQWRRTYLVTHGSPLGRLYRRAFPGYWGGGVIRFVRRETGWSDGAGWLNLHRLTDPIGDAIFTGPDEQIEARGSDLLPAGDRLLPDPGSRWRFELDECPGAAGHSNYLRQRQAVELLDAVAGYLQHKQVSSIDIDVGDANMRLVFTTERADAGTLAARAERLEGRAQQVWEGEMQRQTAAIQDSLGDGAKRGELEKTIQDAIQAEDLLTSIDQVTLTPPRGEAEAGNDP